MPTIPLEEVVAKKFRLEQAPTLLAQREAGLPIAFTRLRAEGPFRGTTLATPPEEAFTFQVALASMPAGDIWIDRRHRQLPGASPGETFVFDLASYPVANLRPPFDFLRFYLPVRTLDQLAYEHGLGRVGGLRTTSVGVPDTIMHGLALAMSSALQNPGASNALFLDAVALAFQAHVIRAYGSRREIGGSAPAGLAPWQLRRVDAFIDAHLDGDPTTAELARECRLSASHFARAFAR